MDKEGNAVTPVLLWADTRCAKEVEELKRILNERNYHARTGCFLHTNFLPAKILWFRRNFPKVAKVVRCWLSFGEYLHLKLFGTTKCSLSMASGTGLLNQKVLDWDDETLSAIGVAREQLAPLVNFEPLEFSRPSPLIPCKRRFGFPPWEMVRAATSEAAPSHPTLRL